MESDFCNNAIAGRESSDAAAVCQHAGADRWAVASVWIAQPLRNPRKRFRYSPGMESCLKKLVLEADATDFQDPEKTAQSSQRERLCWKGAVGDQWVYTHQWRRAKKLILVKAKWPPAG